MPTAEDFRRTEIAEPGYRELRHLPGRDARFRLPAVDTLRFLADPVGYSTASYRRFGPVFRVHHWGGWHVVMLGPDASEYVLMDRDRNFSSQEGWGPFIWRVFPRGVMLMDFDEHRLHRRLLGAAFKPEPMRAYHGMIADGMSRKVGEWGAAGGMDVYPAIKRTTLDLAATAFFGYPLGPEADRIARAYGAMTRSFTSILRTPVPGSAMAAAIRARAEICAMLAAEIPKRRGATGADMMTLLCNSEDEDGGRLSDQAIIDHMNFMIMAAHDTLTSSSSRLVMHLLDHPDWQERLAEEVSEVARETGGVLPHDRLGDLVLTEMAMKEALRLAPPVPSLPRRALRAFEFGGYRVPAGAHIGINPMFTHRMEEHWPDPSRFDPLRFTPERSRERHRHAWIPFGGGAHMCLGLHYGMMEAKILFFTLLSRYRIERAVAGAGRKWRLYPLPLPLDGLPVRLVPRS